MKKQPRIKAGVADLVQLIVIKPLIDARLIAVKLLDN
jgi:hypothetical protein